MSGSNNSNDSLQWWIRSASNGDVFGPVSVGELADWARQSRVFPEDAVSNDRRNWRTARTVPELGMNAIIATPDGRLHGPLHADAAAVLVGKGKLPPGAKVFSAQDLLALSDGDRESSRSEGMSAETQTALQEALEDLKRQTDDAIAEKDREIESLREAADAARAAEAAAKSAAEEAATAAGESKAVSEKELSELRAECDAARAERDAARAAEAAAKAAAEEAATAAGESKAASEKDLSELRAERDAARAERDAAREAEAAAKAAAEEAATAAGESKAASEKELSELRAERDAARAERDAAREAEAAAKAAAEEAAKAAANEADEAAAKRVSEVEENAAKMAAAAEVASDELRLAKASLEKARAELEENKAGFERKLEAQAAEMAELVDFANARDREAKATIAELERRIAEISAPEVPSPDAGGEPVGDARLVKTLQDRVNDLTRERCALSEKLATAEASLAVATRPLEADTALVKRFADEALDALRAAFDSEKARNDVERTASVQRQNALHDRIADLERALRREPGEKTRGELAEERSERTISQLRQEIDALREQHKADLGRAAENERALEGRLQALQHREAAVREQLRRVEKRTADYDSLTSRLRRREEEILEAEKQFGEARTQWQVVEQMLRRRIDELEHGAGSLFENETAGTDAPSQSQKLVLPGWVRNMK